MNAVTKIHPVEEIRLQFVERQQDFVAALPKHIPAERFLRVVMTAVQQNPALAKVERRSLFVSALKAAQDGLLPDGREAALVIYKDKSRGEIAQYMPMIAGIRKKVRNSGEIATWDAQCVHEKDAFEFELGDDPFIKHRPALADRGPVIAAYSIAVLKSGEKSREVMSVGEIEAIRKRSRAKDSGPWVTDYAEMCRKTVARRHSKVLPMSTDLDDLIRRDDDLYDLQGASDKVVTAAERPKSLAGRLDALAAPENGPHIDHDPETGEITDQAESSDEADERPPQGVEGAAPHQGQQADDVPETASSATPSRSPEAQALFDKLAGKAAGGMKRLKMAVGGLSVPEDSLLTEADHDALEAIAERAGLGVGG